VVGKASPSLHFLSYPPSSPSVHKTCLNYMICPSHQLFTQNECLAPPASTQNHFPFLPRPNRRSSRFARETASRLNTPLSFPCGRDLLSAHEIHVRIGPPPFSPPEKDSRLFRFCLTGHTTTLLVQCEPFRHITIHYVFAPVPFHTFSPSRM